MIALDSSVAVAALSPWHPAHEAARAAIASEDRAIAAHAALETVAVLGRLPEGYRNPPRVALAALEAAFPRPWLSLDADAARTCLQRAVAAGVRGGALYDALVGATAVAHDATLVSADRRAQGAYEAVGATVQYVDA